MKYNEKVERFAPKLGRKNLVNGLSCPPFVYMEDSENGMWVHYVKYCEAIAKLKDKIESLENLAKSSSRDFASEYNELKIEIFKLQGRIKELKDERDAFEKSFNEMTDAFMRQQRALWIARAKRAFAEYFFWNHIAFDKKYAKNKFTISHSNSTNSESNKVSRTPREWSDIWYDVEFKCNAYADKLENEYK